MGSGIVRALGLMSGTSLDGIDAAVLETDGVAIAGFGPTLYRPYSDSERALLREATREAQHLQDRGGRPGVLKEAEARLTECHIAAVAELAAKAGGAIDLIGFHGQTLFHAPQRRLTVQIGDGQALADATRLPVVFDMRADDVAAGGQGAPLVPVFHQAAALHFALEAPLAVVNIGGVANATWIGADGALAACDTGPGNALIDDWVWQSTGAAFDAGGELAGRGRPNERVLAELLDNPYFATAYPKSLDRDAFSLDPVLGLAPEDGAATLAAFTARTIAAMLGRFPATPRRVVICGGGARNPVVIAMLKELLACPLTTAGEIGLDADFVEAQAFAYCAVRSDRGLPITFPGTTGVALPLTGGRRVEPRLERLPA